VKVAASGWSNPLSDEEVTQITARPKPKKAADGIDMMFEAMDGVGDAVMDGVCDAVRRVSENWGAPVAAPTAAPTAAPMAAPPVAEGEVVLLGATEETAQPTQPAAPQVRGLDRDDWL
jgi:cell division septation protein DedD